MAARGSKSKIQSKTTLVSAHSRHKSASCRNANSPYFKKFGDEHRDTREGLPSPIRRRSKTNGGHCGANIARFLTRFGKFWEIKNQLVEFTNLSSVNFMLREQEVVSSNLAGPIPNTPTNYNRLRNKSKLKARSLTYSNLHNPAHTYARHLGNSGKFSLNNFLQLEFA